MHFCKIGFFAVFSLFYCCGCAHNLHQKQNRVYFGTIESLKIAPLRSSAKPKKEIARICTAYSPFHTQKQYEILTLENLIKEASKITKKHEFHNVSVWQYSWNVLLWQKKCLILGE